MALSRGLMLVGRYRIEKLLSKGGMGAVYRAFDTTLEMPVAIKENFFRDPDSIAQFKHEALLLARLHDPGLPRVTNHFLHNQKQYLVMDFIEGLDLWQMIKQKEGPLPQQMALDICLQICDTLIYLHNQSPPILHRDIKPQNIKITPDQRAILVDFGLAKQSTGHTSIGAKAVTPGFSPPEQYVGGTTPASDIYALGATFYTLLTAEMPLDSITLLTTSQEFVPANPTHTALSPQLAAAIQAATKLNPDERVSSVAEWKQQLSAISIPTPQVAPTVRLSEPPPRHTTSQPVLLKRGGNVPLKKVAPTLTSLKVALGWQAKSLSSTRFDLDAMVFMLTKQNKVRYDHDLIFYNNLTSTCGAVRHTGSASASQANEEIIHVDITRLPAEIVKLVFVMSIYDAEVRSQDFSMISASIRLTNNANTHELVRYELSGSNNQETAMIFGQLYRHRGKWKFRAVGQGFKDGITALVINYGVNVE